MATIINFTGMNTIEDVQRFINYIIKELGLNWHPDDAFIDYVTPQGVPCFTDEQALFLEDLLEQAFFLCEEAENDLYEIGLDIFRDHLGWLKMAG